MDSEGANDEAQLVAALRASPATFEWFYREHVRGVTRFLAGRCATPEDVADAVASTFMAVLTSKASFDPALGSVRGWLYTIAANEATRQRRASNRRARIQARVQGSRLLSADDAERITELIDAERAARRLQPIIEQAAPNERELLERIVQDDVRPAEASRLLGISPGTGRVRLSRLRARVRRSLDEQSCSALPAGCAPPEGGRS